MLPLLHETSCPFMEQAVFFLQVKYFYPFKVEYFSWLRTTSGRDRGGAGGGEWEALGSPIQAQRGSKGP